jgi:hypothetical protein
MHLNIITMQFAGWKALETLESFEVDLPLSESRRYAL